MITKKEYIDAIKIVRTYEKEQKELQDPTLIKDFSDVCSINRNPDECSINLFTKLGCSTCRNFRKPLTNR